MPILERHAETAVLAGLVEQAVAGHGGFAVLEGPAGVGKTSLLRQAITSAESRELRVLRATGSSLETGFPFGIARGLLSGALDPLSEAAGSRVVSGAARLSAQVMGALPLAEVESISEQAATHVLFSFTANLAAEAPLLLVVDDLHWADTATLRFLHYLARRIDELPVALLGASRPLESELRDPVLAALLGLDVATVLRPGPLGEAAVGELARQLLNADPADDFVAGCVRATGGNAFLVTELLREVARRGVAPSAAVLAELNPEAVRRRTLGWLAELARPAGQVARALAVLSEAELPLLAEMAEVSLSDARRACRELEQVGLLDRSLSLRFAHPLLARAVANTIGAGEASDAHLRAARLLADAGAPLDSCAVHLLAVRPAGSGWVCGRLREAGAAALNRGAPLEAARYLERALAEPPAVNERAELLLALGTAQLRAHDTGAGAETLREGLQAATDGDVRLSLAIALSQACYLSGDVSGAMAVLEAARNAETDERRLLSLDGNAISLGLLDPEHGELPRARLGRYRSQANAGTLDEPVLLALAGAEAILRCEPAGPALELLRRALAGGLTAFNEHTFAFGWLIPALDMTDQADAAIEEIDAALDQTRMRGDAAILSYLLTYRIHLAFRLGRLAEAEANGRAVLELLATAGDVAGFPIPLLDVLAERDGAEEARDLCDRAFTRGSPQRSAVSELVRARVAIACDGGGADDLQSLLDAGAELDAMKLMHPQFAPWRALSAPLADALGEHDLALRLSSELTDLAQRCQAPTAIALALRVRGELTGNLDALKASVAAAQETLDQLEHARSLRALGAAQLNAGDKPAARETLRQALAVAHAAGALTLAAQAHANLVAAGGRPRRAALTGTEALTPSELEVVRLAARGLSNRELADALFIAVKTVEQHLARAYVKLQIDGRAQLPQALGA